MSRKKGSLNRKTIEANKLKEQAKPEVSKETAIAEAFKEANCEVPTA
jgi:hypothetical protein